MNKLISIILICFLPSYLSASDRFGGIKLLDGYKIKKGWTVDAAAWTIYKEGGLIIEFEAGMNEGIWADPKNRVVAMKRNALMPCCLGTCSIGRELLACRRATTNI